VSDVKGSSSPGSFAHVLASAGVAPLRTKDSLSSPQLTAATRRESRERLRTRADRRARSKRNAPPRASALDWMALGFAVMLPPAGLLLSVAAHVVDRRRVGWASTVTKVATGVSCVLSMVFVAGAVVVLDLREEAAAHDAIVASSVEFCAAVEPTLGSDTLGWPAVGATIPLTIAAMEEYTARWNTIAAVAPEGVRDGAQSMATASQTLVDSVSLSRTVDPAGNSEVLRAAASASGVTAWASEYCT
jgi:hypothetical protein